jgi:hypothetical protein
MPAGGGEPVQITQGGGRAPLESPDGKFIFYERGPPMSLWKCAASGGSEEQVSSSAGWQNFTVTRNGIYFIPAKDSDRGNSVQFLGFSTSTARPFFTIHNPVGEGLAVSPDSKFLLYTQVDQMGSELMLVENFR